MSNEKRLHVATAILGRKGTGKSTYLEKLAKAYMAAHEHKKVLIFDVNGSPAYAEHQSVTYGGWKAWKTGIRRFYDQDHDRALKFIAKNFENGLVIFEDCTKYIPSNPQSEIKSLLVDHRMMNADLAFTFHGLEFIPPFFWKMITAVSVGVTNDVWDGATIKQRTFPNKEKIIAAGLSLQRQTDQYKRILVTTDI